MKIHGDIKLKFTEEGMKLDVKDLNINNFCIDNVFKHIEKKRKKGLKKDNKKTKLSEGPVLLSPYNSEEDLDEYVKAYGGFTKNLSLEEIECSDSNTSVNEEEYYTIEINV